MPQTFQTLDIVSGETLGFEPVEEVSAEVSVGRAAFQHMVEDDQQRVAHRDEGSFLASAAHQAPIREAR